MGSEVRQSLGLLSDSNVENMLIENILAAMKLVERMTAIHEAVRVEMHTGDGFFGTCRFGLEWT
jgi:hypothetical protein